MKKANLTVLKIPIIILIFALVVTGFYIVPNLQDVNNQGNTTSFWNNYGVSPANTELSEYDLNQNISEFNRQMQCDVFGTYNNTNCKPKSTSGTDFINLMVKGGYGVLVTMFNSVFLVKDLVILVSTSLGVPSAIVNIIITWIVIIVLITIVLLIFNRSDV